MATNQNRNKIYGLNSFERKLLAHWLKALKIDNSKLTVEQRLKYIQYPGFQVLLKSYRDQKRSRRLYRFLTVLRHALRSHTFIVIYMLIILLSIFQYA